MCARVCVCVCVCARITTPLRDLATLSSLLRNPLPATPPPPPLPPPLGRPRFLPDVFTAAKIKVCAATRGSRGSRRIGRETRLTLMFSLRVLFGAKVGAVVDTAAWSASGIASNSPGVGYNGLVEEVNSSRWWTVGGWNEGGWSIRRVFLRSRSIPAMFRYRLSFASFFSCPPLPSPPPPPLPSLHLSSSTVRIFVFHSFLRTFFPSSFLSFSLSLSFSLLAPSLFFRWTTIFCFHFFGKQSGGGGREHQLFLARQRGNNERR